MKQLRELSVYGLTLSLLITTVGCTSSSLTTMPHNSEITKTTETDCKPVTVRKDYHPVIKRIATDANADWGLESIHAADVKSKGSKTPIVAVIDSGSNLSNENVLPGYNAINDTTDVKDDSGHGTTITSLILKVAPQSKILPVKVMDEKKEQDPAIVAKGINLAIENGAQVINLSLAVPNESPELKQAILHATNKGIPVIAATGNDSREELPFPANMSSVISVIARDINNVDVAFSNVSSCKKSVSAPGVHLRTEDGFKSGTSFAAALVTGTVSLIKSSREDLDVKTIQAILEQTSVDGSDFSYGLIQADQAVSQATEK
ncbi:S8 family peptidase [Effusibacillus consociatus]|uniref:S8 family serine peptidase n=1 Tax=Effusibacillus consociatus TaxID=1117041 RepID=A0ABV9Q4V9_9BACL